MQIIYQKKWKVQGIDALMPSNVFLDVSNVCNAVAVFITEAMTCIFMWHSVLNQNVVHVRLHQPTWNDKVSVHPISQKKNHSHQWYLAVMTVLLLSAEVSFGPCPSTDEMVSNKTVHSKSNKDTV